MNQNDKAISAMATALAATMLRQAVESFTGNPSPDNWRELFRSALVYQQERSIFGEEDREALATAMADAPIGRWPDIIVRQATGRSINDFTTPLEN